MNKNNKLVVLHFLVGAGFFLGFILSGLYLKSKYPETDTNYDAVRMMFRGNHIYLLLSAMINFILSLYFRSLNHHIAWRMQVIGSGFLLISPFILAYAFINEPINRAFDRDITFYGVLFILLGALLHGVARYTDLRFNAKTI